MKSTKKSATKKPAGAKTKPAKAKKKATKPATPRAPISDATRAKLSAASKGNGHSKGVTPWNAGKKAPACSHVPWNAGLTPKQQAAYRAKKAKTGKRVAAPATAPAKAKAKPAKKTAKKAATKKAATKKG